MTVKAAGEWSHSSVTKSLNVFAYVLKVESHTFERWYGTFKELYTIGKSVKDWIQWYQYDRSQKFSTRVMPCMNDYIITCKRSNITSTFVAFFGQNRCFMSVRRYFQPNRPKKLMLIFLTDVRLSTFKKIWWYMTHEWFCKYCKSISIVQVAANSHACTTCKHTIDIHSIELHGRPF